MVVVDVKNSYLSGLPSEVSEDVASLFDPPLRELIKVVIYNLMDNQFVYASILQTFYKCFHGTGMGLKHSGHCANLAFYAAVEKAFVHRLHTHGIALWLRYHDDIFAVFIDKPSMDNFLIPLVRQSLLISDLL